MSRKGVSTVGAVLVLIVLLVIAVYLWSSYPRPQPEPSSLSFSFDFPKAIVAGHSAVMKVKVANNGSDAKGVEVVIVSDAISAASDDADVRRGTTTEIKVSITGKDVQDGPYAVVVFLQYSDELGVHKTDSKGASVYLLPRIELIDVRFQADLFHPFGKNTIGKKDTTSLLFKISSKSTSVIYNGLSGKAAFSVNVPGISIDPLIVSVEPVGPNGKTADYSFKITSDGAPPGTYNVTIFVYSKDNQLVAQQTVQLVVIS